MEADSVDYVFTSPRITAREMTRNFTHKGDVVFDPFMGVETTAKSCKKYGRHWLGCEIVEKYCEDANNV